MEIRKGTIRTLASMTLIMFLGSTVCNVSAAQMPVSSSTSTSPAVVSVEPPKVDMPAAGNVTVNFKNVDIKTVLHYLSEISGVDIVPSPGVEGTITMRLRNKPWEVALDILTRNYGYAHSREGDIIRVIPKDQLHMEAPITEVIPLNHIIREVELTKTEDTDVVSVQARQESIIQLMSAITSMLDTGRGEKATFINSVNAIVVTAIPARISTIKELVAKVDKKTPQVVLDAKVIEITLGKDNRFGVDWNAVITAAGARRPTSFPFTNAGILPWFGDVGQNRFFPNNAQATGAKDFPLLGEPTLFDPLTGTLSDDALFTFGTLDFSSFSAVMSMIKNRTDTKILSSPRITTLNNQTAQIKVVEKIMLQKTIETTQTASLVTVEFEDEENAREVGVKLTVSPHVNENGDIAVNLLPEVSTNSGFTALTISATNSTVALTFNSREANTIVRVRDGETIFIGGLIRETVTVTEDKVPILGDLLGGIPVLEHLFKYDGENVERTEIAFFVTVHLIKDAMESVIVSDTMDQYRQYISKETDKMKVDSLGEGEKNRGTEIMQAPVREKTDIVEIPVQKATATKKTAYKPFLDFRKKK